MAAVHDTSPEPPNGADARFAAWLADAAAHVDDPERGEYCRNVLAKSPKAQRKRFDFEDNIVDADIPTPVLIGVTVVVAALIAVAFVLVRVLT